MDRQVTVTFCCQRCSLPIRLDPRFYSLEEYTIAELSLPVTSCSNVDVVTQEGFFNHVVLPRLNDSGAATNGFTVVSDQGEAVNMGHQAKVTTRLMDFLSDHSDIDHPLCEKCTDQLLDQLNGKLHQTEEDCQLFQDYYHELEVHTDPEDMSQLEKELTKLMETERSLMESLLGLLNEERRLLNLLENENEVKEHLDKDMNLYNRSYCKYRRELQVADDEYRSLTNQLQYTTKQLEKLKKTNVFNATFHIWHSGHFGTINNFRLGRLPSVPVDWPEINAAWGQTALLMSAIARKLNFTFDRYKIVPFGNHSYIEVLADHRELPLYGTGGFRFFWDTKFDQAMVAFLDCLHQFQQRVEKNHTGFCLPYKLHPGKVEDAQAGVVLSVKVQFNSEEQWTKALKFILTNLKWGLAWVSADSTSSPVNTTDGEPRPPSQLRPMNPDRS